MYLSVFTYVRKRKTEKNSYDSNVILCGESLSTPSNCRIRLDSVFVLLPNPIIIYTHNNGHTFRAAIPIRLLYPYFCVSVNFR